MQEFVFLRVQQTCGMLLPRVARETIQSELVATIYGLALTFSGLSVLINTFCSRYFFPLQNSDFLCFHSRQNHEKVFSFDSNKERFRKFSPSFNSFNYKKLSVFLIWFVEKNFNIKFTIVLYWFCRVEKDSIVWSLVSLNKATRNHLTSVIQFE